MNQFFSWDRWRLLTGKHWSENRKKYLLSLTAMAGLLTIWFVFVLFANGYLFINDGIQAGAYFFGLVLVGSLYASQLFAELASKSKGTNYLSLPASHAEKLACNIFFGLVCFSICYTTIFYLVDFTMVKITNEIAYERWLQKHETGDVFKEQMLINIFIMPNRPVDEPNLFNYFLLGFVAIQAAFMLGSIYFPKYSFIKTVISLLLLFFLIMAFMKGLHDILPAGNFYKNLISYNFYSPQPDANGRIVELPNWAGIILSALAWYAPAPLLWLITYFRLKEKEI
ncbi:MAG: hypothetical protein ABI480_15750 [Chitinophagaceae bacterium]